MKGPMKFKQLREMYVGSIHELRKTASKAPKQGTFQVPEEL